MSNIHNDDKKNAALTMDFYLKRSQREASNIDERLATQVGWSSYNTQLAGFKLATELDNIGWKSINSVLDIGCGYGSLINFLRKDRGFDGYYTGIDIMPNYIEIAKGIHKNNKNKFIEGDFFRHNWGKTKFDVVISLGIISVNYDYPALSGIKSMNHARKAIKAMGNLAKHAVSLYFPNANNINSYDKVPEIAYYAICDIEEIIITEIKDRLSNIYITAYPNQGDVRTIARLLLK